MITLCRIAILILLISSWEVKGFGLAGRGFKFHGPPLGPVSLTPVNSSTRWGDIFEDTVQHALDHCKSVRMCNTTGLFSFSDSGCSACHPCSCNQDCYDRRDCCIDKQLRDVSERLVLDSPLPVSPPVFGCHDTYLTHYDLAVHAFMADTCPENWKDEEMADRCLHPSPNETFSHWPVWSRITKTVYRNVDCARCNNEALDHVVRWNLKVACDRSVYLRHSNNLMKALEKALEEPTCQILFVPPQGCRPVPCKPVKGHYIDTCNATGLRHSYDQTLWKACGEFHGQMTVAGNTYKNAFCAMCNHEKMVIPGVCETDPPFPFFLEVNGTSFRTQSDNKEPDDKRCGCAQSEVYDKFEDKCRPLQCSMTRELRHGQCQPIVTNSSGIFYDLSLSLTPADPTEPVQMRGTSTLTRVARNIRTAFLLQGSHTTGWHVMTHLFRVVAETEGAQSRGLGTGGDSQELFQVLRFQVHIKFCSTWPEPSEALESRLFDLMKSQWNFSVDGHTKRSFKASPLYVERSEGGAKTYQRVSLLSSEGRIKEFVVDLPDSHIQSHGGELLETNYYLPISEALRCARVSFNLSQEPESGEVTLVVNKTSGTVHHLPSDKFISFQFVDVGQDGEISVCADEIFDGSGPGLGSYFPINFFSLQLLVITVIFQVLSIFFLVLVLLTFVVFAELRTVAGKNLICLVCMLILAIALTGGSMLGISSGCLVLGVVSHFFVLSTVAWAVICMFHSYHSFSGKSGCWKAVCLSEPPTFQKCFVVGLVTPTFIVVLTIVSNVLHSQNDCVIDIGYGRGICFTSAENGVIATACVCLMAVIASVVHFIWTFWDRRGIASNRSESYRQHFHRFLAQTFLTVLMAMAWFVRMLSLLGNKEILWHFSSILCLGLAVFIFITFVCKKQVLKLWYAWFVASFACGDRLRNGPKFSQVDS